MREEARRLRRSLGRNLARRTPALVAGLALLLGACASSGYDSRAPEPEIDYPARQDRMYDAVLLQPTAVRSQIEARQQYHSEQDAAAWKAVMARQRYIQTQQQQSRTESDASFQRLMQRQRVLDSAREHARTERIAQFLERSAPPKAASPSGTP